MNNLVDTFANRLNRALSIRNIKPTELSEKTGLDKSKISSYMSGRYKAKQDGVYKISQALNVDPAWLMGYDVPMERTSEIPYSAIYDFSTENDRNTLETAIIYAIQNNLNKNEIPNNSHIISYLTKLESLNKTQAITIIQNLSDKFKGKSDFSLEDYINSLHYKSEEPKIDDIYMHLAKEAQNLKLDEEDVNAILNLYKKYKK